MSLSLSPFSKASRARSSTLPRGWDTPCWRCISRLLEILILALALTEGGFDLHQISFERRRHSLDGFLVGVGHLVEAAAALECSSRSLMAAVMAAFFSAAFLSSSSQGCPR